MSRRSGGSGRSGAGRSSSPSRGSSSYSGSRSPSRTGGNYDGNRRYSGGRTVNNTNYYGGGFGGVGTGFLLGSSLGLLTGAALSNQSNGTVVVEQQPQYYPYPVYQQYQPQYVYSNGIPMYISGQY